VTLRYNGLQVIFVLLLTSWTIAQKGKEMFTEMQAMLDRNAADLLAGNTGAIADRCHYPMTVHAPDKVVPFQTASAYAAVLAHIADRLRNDYKVTEVIARLRTMDVPRGGRFRAWARLTYRFAIDTAPRETNVTYYCRLVNGQIRVEMVEMDCEVLPDHPISGQAA
jgi:hypothetical protein